MPLHHRRNHHRDRPIRILLLHFQHIVDDRMHHQPKRRRQCHQLRTRRPCRRNSLPLPRRPIFIRVAHHMQRLHIRRQRHRKLQRLLRRRIPLVHRNNHNRRLQVSRPQNRRTRQRNFFPHPFIMTPHPPHEHQHCRQQQHHHHPRPLGKLRNHNHHHRDPRGQSADAVDQHPVRRLESRRRPLPMPDHPCLRQSERHECPHRKQRDQPIRHSSKQNQQEPRKNRQRPDPLREHQPPPP